jgi:hypothetical protein
MALAEVETSSGGRTEGSGLFELVSSQPDFVNEVTLLQYFTEQRSVAAGCQLMLICSPKCRPELDGEGIEYDWGATKQWYRRQKLAEKRATDKFRKLVIQSLNQVKVNLRMEFSRRARQYMLLYQTLVTGIPRWNWWEEGSQVIHRDRERPGEAQIQSQESSVGNRRAPCSWRPPSQCGY